jgi:PKD repeat protein
MGKKMSFRKIILLAGLLSVFLGPNCFADNILSVPEIAQEHSQWCWVGSSQAVLAYYNSTNYPTQCEIANWAWGFNDCCGDPVFDSNSACNQANYMWGNGSLQAILTNWGVNSHVVQSFLAEDTARSELDAGRPFVIFFAWTDGGGHFLDGRGISGDYLYYMDPWPGNGYTISTYSWVVSASDHTWEDSLQITTTPAASGFTASTTSGKAPMTVHFTDKSVGSITSWLWNFGDGNSSNSPSPSHTYSKAGAYTVTLTVSGAGGTSTCTKSNYITVYTAPKANFSAAPASGKAPLQVIFTDESTGAITSWLWSFGDATTSKVESPEHTYSKIGTHAVKLTVTGPGGVSSKTLSIRVTK